MMWQALDFGAKYAHKVLSILHFVCIKANQEIYKKLDKREKKIEANHQNAHV